LKTANIEAAGKDASFVAGRRPGGVLCAARLSARVATKNTWRSSVACRTFDFALFVVLRYAQVLVIDVGRRFVSVTLSMTAQPRDEVIEVLAVRRAWVLSAVSWSEGLLSRN
jgi:hypothetical protein